MGTLSSRESVTQKALERSVGVKAVLAHAAIFGDTAYEPSNERPTFKSVTQTAHREIRGDRHPHGFSLPAH